MENAILNGRGYLAGETTLTALATRVRKTQYYTISNLRDYVDIEVNRGGLADQVLNFTISDVAGDYRDGFASTAENAKIPVVDIQIGTMLYRRHIWNKIVQYRYIDAEQAGDNRMPFDIIEAKTEALKRHFDLTLQTMIFVGDLELGITGLLNNPNITIDSATLPTNLSSLTSAQINEIVGQMLTKYTDANFQTAFPNRLLVPFGAYLGLSSATSAEFPIKTKMDFLEDSFKQMTGNGDFKILPLAYANGNNQYNTTGKDTYVLYRKDIDTLAYDLAKPFDMRGWNSPNNYDFQNVGYGMLGGTNIFRPLEVMYFQPADAQ